MFKEFKEFATKGSVIDMAVGIIIGAAFSPIVKSLVDNIIMPPVGLLLGNADFSNLYMIIKEGSTPGPYTSPAAAQEAGAVIIGYGLFINTIINFVIVAFAIFLLIRGVNRMRRQQEKPPAEPTTKACPQCLMEVPLKASRCGHCTSTLAP